MLAIAVRREPAAQIEAGLAARYEVEERGCHDGAEHLRDRIGQHFGPAEASARRKPNAHRRIEVAPRDVADGEGHGQYGEPEGGGDAQQTNADPRKGGGEHGAATAAEDQPERADEFRDQTDAQCHVSSPRAAWGTECWAPASRPAMGPWSK